VLLDHDQVATRVVRMVHERTVVSIDGAVVPLDADTICIHGDTPGAATLARIIRSALEASGATIASLSAATEL
jgi:UPF0271 protein